MPTYEERMGEALGWDWPGFGSEEEQHRFSRDLDEAVAAGAMTAAQADTLFGIAQSQGADAADRALLQTLQANRQAAAGGALAPTLQPGAIAGAIPGGVPAARGAPGRGKIATMVVRQRDGQVELVSSRQGGVALYAQDLAAVKRVKRVEKKLRRVFPRRPRKRKVFKAAGSAIA